MIKELMLNPQIVAKSGIYETEKGVLSVLEEGIKSRPEIQKALGFSQTTTIVTIAALLDK